MRPCYCVTAAAAVGEQRLEETGLKQRRHHVPRQKTHRVKLLTIQPKPCRSSCCCNKCGQPAANRCPSPIPQTLRSGQPYTPHSPRGLGHLVGLSSGHGLHRIRQGAGLKERGETTLVSQGPAYLGPWSRNHFLPRFVIHPPFPPTTPAFHYPDTTPPTEHRRQPKTFQTFASISG